MANHSYVDECKTERLNADGFICEINNLMPERTVDLNDVDSQATVEKVTENSGFLGSKPSEENTSFVKQFLSDPHLRHKMLHTLCVCLSMVALGWRQSMTGATLPDLRLITNENLENMSWVISALALGALFGCFVCGFLYDRVNKYAMFVGLLFCYSAISAATPWCSLFISMVIIHVLNGICTGGIDTVVAADIALVWGHKSAPFLQAVNFAFSIGATISPLTSEPFMAKSAQHTIPNTTTDFQTTPNATSLINVNSSINQKDKSNIYELHFTETNVYFAFIIAATISLLSSMCFVLLFCIIGNVHTRKEDNEDNQAMDKENEKFVYSLSRKWKIVFVIVLSIMLSIYAISERHYYTYLMSFLVDRLHWTKAEGSKATTVFWLTFAIGRLISVFIVRILKLTHVFGVFLFILIVGEVVMYFGVRYDITSLLWLSFVFHGFGLSTLFANILSWLSTHVCPLSGKVASVVFTVMVIGTIIFPIIAGNVMVSLSYDWFMYLEMILTSSLVSLVLFVELLYRFLIK